MSLVERVQRRTKIIRPSGRSTDFIAPSFGHGCLLNCTYCYMKRHKPVGLSVAKNVNDILTEINSHAWFDTTVVKPNQTHEQYITYDISCNEDFALHRKYYDWENIFQFFVEHELAMGSFATKIIPTEFLEFNPQGKIRIRFSLITPRIADDLEPNTAAITDRIKAVNKFIEAGYDVHLNFSPVVVYDGWLTDYAKLFATCDALISKENQSKVLAEVIFLTHNESKHFYNIDHKLTGESLIWTPENQEEKTSQYGGRNLRYRRDLKAKYIRQWRDLHDEMIPWNKIRYIF